MNSKFAKGIAASIRTIAECTAQIAIIDQSPLSSADREKARAELVAKIDNAEAAIATFLSQQSEPLDDWLN